MFKISFQQFFYKSMAILLVLAFALSGFRVQTAHAATPGTVVAWGVNFAGEANVPSGLNDVVAIAAGYYHALALKSDGTVVIWGSNSYGQTNIPSGLSGVTAIAAGNYHSLALKSDGTVVAWGINLAGVTNVPGGLSDVVTIAAGNSHNLALKSDRTVAAWGSNSNGQTNVPSGLSDVIAIAAGANHSLALKSDGTVVAWGDNSLGQTNVPAGLSDVVAIAAGGAYHNLALKSDGTVVAWGNNRFGQIDVPGGLSGVTAIAAGLQHSLALKSDGTVVAWGSNDLRQTDVPSGLNDVVAISAGQFYNLALVSADEDTTLPTIAITTPADGVQYFLSQVVDADYACQDEADGSGLASCAGTTANGSLIDTSSVGPKSFTVNASDNAGNPASLTHNYSVVYNFSGFFQPVDNLPTLNMIKGGVGVAVKFSLGGNQGLNILAAGYPISQQVACEGGLPVDDIEQTVAAGNSSLSYNAATNTYSYIWKTDKAWAGTCRQLIVKLSDGAEHRANFKFK